MSANQPICVDKDVSADKHCILVDGYGFVFRAYHSLPPLSRPDGTPIGAVYGFTNMLLKLRESHKAEYIAVILDASGPTFRNEIFSEYKANRPPAPEDLIPQFPIVRDAIDALQIQRVEQSGYEADDLIATYNKQAKERGWKVTIISSDKDLMQLVDDKTSMLDPMKNRHIGVEQVQEKFGVGPDKLLDVLSLMGDNADNVAGVPGIGPKIAAQLVNDFGCLDNILAGTAQVKQKKRRQNLEDYKEQALLARDLITLHFEVPVTANLDSFAVQSLDESRLYEFAKEQNFKTLISRYRPEAEAENKVEIEKAVEWQKALISNQLDLEEWIKSREEVSEFSCFIKLSKENKVLSIVIIVEQYCAYIEIGSGQAVQASLFDIEQESQPKITIKEAFEQLSPWFASNNILTIGHDMKPLLYLLNEHGHSLGWYEDVMIMSYTLYAGLHDHSLEKIADHLLDGFDSNMDPKLKYKDMSVSERMESSCASAVIISASYPYLSASIFKQQQCIVYQRVEKPLMPILNMVERNGIKVNASYLGELSRGFAITMLELESAIFTAAGEEFNIASPKQLGQILFEKMQLPQGKKSKKTGSYSTDVAVLHDLSEQGHDIANLILEWRQLAKLKSTYSDNLPKQIAIDGRIHTSFSQTTTNTGRLSSHDPNLQNIPIRSEQGNKIRVAFIAPKDHLLISADYSQIELRLLAQMADIPSLKQAFIDGLDVHAATASDIFSVPIEQVDSNLRRKAKAINFGIIYGMSAFGLAKRLQISRQEASDYIKSYFIRYPGIQGYMDETISYAKDNGYVKTIMGRHCHIKNINNRNGALRQFSERAAINAPLQGSAADIIKKAMIAISKDKKLQSLSAKMLLQVHDELIFEVPKNNAEDAAAAIKTIMENAFSLSFPLKVDVGIGNNWAEIH